MDFEDGPKETMHKTLEEAIKTAWEHVQEHCDDTQEEKFRAAFAAAGGTWCSGDRYLRVEITAVVTTDLYILSCVIVHGAASRAHFLLSLHPTKLCLIQHRLSETL